MARERDKEQKEERPQTERREERGTEGRGGQKQAFEKEEASKKPETRGERGTERLGTERRTERIGREKVGENVGDVEGKTERRKEGRSSDLQRYLTGVDYPASKNDLLEAARRNDAPEDVLSALRGLQDKKYEGPPQVMQSYGQH